MTEERETERLFDQDITADYTLQGKQKRTLHGLGSMSMHRTWWPTSILYLRRQLLKLYYQRIIDFCCFAFINIDSFWRPSPGIVTPSKACRVSQTRHLIKDFREHVVTTETNSDCTESMTCYWEPCSSHHFRERQTQNVLWNELLCTLTVFRVTFFHSAETY